LAATLFFALPIIALPCREVAIELVQKVGRFVRKRLQLRDPEVRTCYRI
jgi:hypothetical protein